MLKREGCSSNSCDLFVRQERDRPLNVFEGICQERNHSTAAVSSVHNMFGTFAMKSCKISEKNDKNKWKGEMNIFGSGHHNILHDFKVFSEVQPRLQKFWTSHVIASDSIRKRIF